MIKKFISIMGCMALTGCTSIKIQKGVYTSPSKIDQSRKTIALAFTKDFKGQLKPIEEEIPNKRGHNIKYKTAGTAVLKTYFNILRDTYKDSLYIIESGSSFSENHKDINETIRYYNEVGYNFVAYTSNEHQNLLSTDQLKNFSPKLINSNIIKIKKGRVLSNRNILPYGIIRKGKFKIGIISVAKSDITRKEATKLQGLFFQDPVLSVLKTAKRLKRREKVNGIILLANFSNLKCDQKVSSCKREDQELIKMVKRLPNKSIDLVVGGTNLSDGVEINGIPILGSTGKGQYIHLVKFHDYDTNELEVSTSTIKTCHYFFTSTNDCFIPKSKEAKEKIKFITNQNIIKEPATFLGKTIVKDRETTLREKKSKAN